MSYSKFTYSDLSLDKNLLCSNDSLTVSVKVRNDTAIKGKETVQLYIRDLFGQVLRPDKELKYFKKITLQPYEERVISFVIDSSMLSYTGLDMNPVLEEGEFEVLVGGSSVDLLSGKFELKY